MRLKEIHIGEMSSNGDGDDLVNLLKHQRVSSLLGEHIPADEAKLLSNGRLTCTVCNHRPVFDTVLMLGKHRKGKKHIWELSKYLKRKEELELKALKKKQLEHLQQETKTHQRLLGKGSSEGSQTERKKILEVPRHSTTTTSKNVASELHSSRSGKSQVRHYLKTLQRKRTLEYVIEKKKDNYGNIGFHEKPESDSYLQFSPEVMSSLKKNTNKEPLNVCLNPDFHCNLSGWIRDKDGKWIKDTNAEFDSDEDSPPSQA